MEGEFRRCAHEHPLVRGVVRAAVPEFGSIDDPFVAVELGTRREAREVGSGVRFRVPDREGHLVCCDLRQPHLLVRVGSITNDDWCEAGDVDLEFWRPEPFELLNQD